MEVIWGNRLKPGDYKYIGGFPHFVADGGEDRIGRWLEEKIDLARVYSEIWKDAAPAHVTDIAVFCDSDDTHTASISYFEYDLNGGEARTGGLCAGVPWKTRLHDRFRSNRAYGGPQRVSLTTKAAAAAATRVTASASTACGQRSSGRWNSGLLPTKVT
jgi:hypothetical protein